MPVFKTVNQDAGVKCVKVKTNMQSLRLQCLSRKYHRQFVLCEMTFPAIIHSTANILHNLSRKTISARPWKLIKAQLLQRKQYQTYYVSAFRVEGEGRFKLGTSAAGRRTQSCLATLPRLAGPGKYSVHADVRIFQSYHPFAFQTRRSSFARNSKDMSKMDSELCLL